jgi:hypothetical protein
VNDDMSSGMFLKMFEILFALAFRVKYDASVYPRSIISAAPA